LTGHRQLVEQSAANVGAAARADEQLTAHLTAAAARHHRGRNPRAAPARRRRGRC
jgi:hypothetical protein